MFLYDVYSFNAENTDAVNVARRLTATVKYVAEQGINGDFDVFIIMWLDLYLQDPDSRGETPPESWRE